MSKGSKRITMRLGKELNDLVMEEVARRNKQGGGVTEWNVSDWIASAIIDKINHSHRSRRTGTVVKMHVNDLGQRRVAVFVPPWCDQDADAGKVNAGESPAEDLTPTQSSCNIT